jgi:hypothetical protein
MFAQLHTITVPAKERGSFRFCSNVHSPRELALTARAGSFSLVPLLLIMVLAVLIAPAEGQTDSNQEFINRRQQVRTAPLTTSKGIYAHYCDHCHGETGKGDGRLWATELPPPGPADLTTTHLDRAALVKFIAEGSAASGRQSNFCPPWGRTISKPDTERLARYVVSLRGPAQITTNRPETQLAGAPFPWALLGLILAEVALLVWLVRRKRGPSHVVPEDPAVR